MEKLIAASIEKIHGIAKNFVRPAVLCSFGKDSMVLLHLVRKAGYDWPVVFYREPHFPAKYDFANSVISKWNLSVYDYPARFRTVLSKNGGLEVVAHYPFGKSEILVPVGVYEPENFDGKYLCSKDDILSRATGEFNVPWSAFVVGHKDSDTDPIQGSLKLHLDQKQTPGCPTMTFPIRGWTDKDIWQYSEEHGVPIHLDRYEKVDGEWSEKKDRSLNPDWFPACSRCIDKTAGEYVYCPKAKGVINNIGFQVPAPALPTYYGQ
jgi:hypothetical protein